MVRELKSPKRRRHAPLRLIARMIGRALLLRCPRCGGGHLLRHWLALRAECPQCGLRLERGEGDYWLGGYLFNFIAAELIWAASMVWVVIATYPDVPWDFLQTGGCCS
jgi:uncharacterized protein (DUF983 family)